MNENAINELIDVTECKKFSGGRWGEVKMLDNGEKGANNKDI